MSFGFRRLGLRNRRWNESLPRNSASCGRSCHTLASTLRKFSFASPTHKPGSGVNQSSLRSHSMEGSRRSSSKTCGLSARCLPLALMCHSWPVHSQRLPSVSLLACRRSSRRSPCISKTKIGLAVCDSHSSFQSMPSRTWVRRSSVMKRVLSLLMGARGLPTHLLRSDAGGLLRRK